MIVPGMGKLDGVPKRKFARYYGRSTYSIVANRQQWQDINDSRKGLKLHPMQNLQIILTRMTARLILAAVALTTASLGAAAQTTLIDTFKDWAAYEHNGDPSKICFALSKPLKSSPKSLQREPAFFYVSAWPKDGVKAEVSVKMGYEIKKDSIATIKIGSASFRLLTESDKAFIDDPTAELKLLEAMKRGSTMTVEGETASGQTSRDTYSLRGVTKAIRTLTNNCS